MKRFEAIGAWLSGSLTSRPIEVVRIVLTPEAKCNLACEHCYWKHDLVQGPVDFSSSHQRIVGMVEAQATQDDLLHIVYAGRIMSKRAVACYRGLMASLEQACKDGRISKDSYSFGAIDNGYWILDYPEFFADYEYINISIDGWRESHDRQRNKAGSFDVAWGTVMELKRQGYDPIAASAIGPLSMKDWDRFEDLLAEHDVRSSSTFVWDMEATKAREVSSIRTPDQLIEYFETLVSGVPKLINLYDPEHVRILKPLLKEHVWRLDSAGDGLCTDINGSHLLYRPPSISLYREAEMIWTGGLVTVEGTGRVSLDGIPEVYFQKVFQLALEEKEIWEGIPTIVEIPNT